MNGGAKDPLHLRTMQAKATGAEALLEGGAGGTEEGAGAVEEEQHNERHKAEKAGTRPPITLSRVSSTICNCSRAAVACCINIVRFGVF